MSVRKITLEEKKEIFIKLIETTGHIVSGHASKNQLSKKEMTECINSVYDALEQIAYKTVKLHTTNLNPAQTVTPDYIICLEDGKKLKMLKRYLARKYNMSPEQYKKKWNLPDDYPFTAPNYAKKRSKLARKTGLGKK